MLRNFIPGKLARFAVLLLFVFLPAQSGTARTQGDSQQLFSSIIEDARNSGGWSDCQYGDGNLLECHTKDLSVSPVYASKSLVRPLKQSGVTLTAYGKNCWSGHPILIGEGCFVWSFEFDPAGGPVVGSYDFQQSSGNAFSESQGTIEGFFQGGDGGAISGTFSGQFTYGEPGVVETVTRPTIGTWKGNLYANGTGLGTYTGDDLWGDWSVQFDATALQNALALGEENTVVQPSPDPYIDPNPDPEPGPVKIDPEIISILQSILGTPVVPITGAIAGGLVAWVISMLGGGRTVLPPAPRPPTGGLRPGQMGPNGKILSPTGQGWVSKSIYDYQQKWLQKGWRWNSQTNKLEVQPGAINEKGQVWYKLPHEMDEGDSHYWVDKAKVQEIERNLADGMVWDRNVDWQAPNDLKRIQSDKDAIRQRSREFNAKKNAEIQKAVQDASQKRQEEYQDWLKKYEQKEQMPVKLTNLNADLDAIDQDLTKQNIYVTNKLQGDPTLIFQGLEVLTNGVWDSTIGNFTGSQGFTCGNYVDKTINPVTDAVKKQFPGAKVQQVVFEEKSTKNPSGFFGTLDSWNTENHTLIKVTLPDGPELAVDFHQHNASNVLENPPLVQPYDKARKPWKKYLGEDFMETIE